jgi:nucleoside-diphosphate-sugar epimerase
LSDSDLTATVLRLPMVYGPGAREAVKRRFFAYLKRFDDRRPAILLDERTARWRAPWGYTGDVAEAVRLVVENERTAGEIYNVGESDGLDIQNREHPPKDADPAQFDYVAEDAILSRATAPSPGKRAAGD